MRMSLDSRKHAKQNSHKQTNNMSGKLISIKVDVTKLDKNKFFKSDKGAVYADLDVWINEDEEEDWKKVSINQSQTKEEREAKAQKTFCGNGKLLFGW